MAIAGVMVSNLQTKWTPLILTTTIDMSTINVEVNKQGLTLEELAQEFAAYSSQESSPCRIFWPFALAR